MRKSYNYAVILKSCLVGLTILDSIGRVVELIGRKDEGRMGRGVLGGITRWHSRSLIETRQVLVSSAIEKTSSALAQKCSSLALLQGCKQSKLLKLGFSSSHKRTTVFLASRGEEGRGKGPCLLVVQDIGWELEMKATCLPTAYHRRSSTVFGSAFILQS